MADTDQTAETPASLTMALACIIQEPPKTNTGTNLQHLIARPLSTGIDAKIKAKIWANEYVEFESLMSNKQKDQNQLTLGSVSFVIAKSSNFKINGTMHSTTMSQSTAKAPNAKHKVNEVRGDHYQHWHLKPHCRQPWVMTRHLGNGGRAILNPYHGTM